MYTPTHIIHKTLSRIDPDQSYTLPSGPLYRASRWVRDFPFKHPVLSVLGGPGHVLPYAVVSAYATAREAINAVPGFVRMLGRIGSRRPEFTAPMVDTRMAMSMRQASLRAIHDSGYFLRSVLGQEARLLHR